MQPNNASAHGKHVGFSPDRSGQGEHVGAIIFGIGLRGCIMPYLNKEPPKVVQVIPEAPIL